MILAVASDIRIRRHEPPFDRDVASLLCVGFRWKAPALDLGP